MNIKININKSIETLYYFVECFYSNSYDFVSYIYWQKNIYIFIFFSLFLGDVLFFSIWFIILIFLNINWYEINSFILENLKKYEFNNKTCKWITLNKYTSFLKLLIFLTPLIVQTLWFFIKYFFKKLHKTKKQKLNLKIEIFYYDENVDEKIDNFVYMIIISFIFSLFMVLLVLMFI